MGTDGRAPRGSRSAAAAALGALLLAAGCSGAEETLVEVPDGAPSTTAAPSTGGPSTSSAPSTSAPSTSTPATGAPSSGAQPSAAPSTPAPAVDGDVFVVPETPVVAPDLPPYELEISSVSAEGPQEQAVVDAWRAFWEAVVTASGVPAYDAVGMGEVATDQALVDARSYVEGLEQAQQRVTGRLVLAAEDVVVEGGTAVVDGCGDQRDGEVDADGGVVSSPLGPTGLRTELVREGESWRVSLWGEREGLC